MAEVKNKMMRGDDFLIAAVIKDATDKDTMVRPFDQTDSSHSVEADEIEAASKDRTISDYGKVTETRSFEGLMAEGDPFPAAALKKLRNKEYIEIYEINKRTKEAEKGTYMITSFEKTASTGEFATYSLEVKLSGLVTTEKLTTIPPGAGETVPAGS